jgi:hypothetical protein
LLRFVVGDDEHGNEAFHDVILSFLITERETASSSSTLTWFFWLILSWPDVVAGAVARQGRHVPVGELVFSFLCLEQFAAHDLLLHQRNRSPISLAG